MCVLLYFFLHTFELPFIPFHVCLWVLLPLRLLTSSSLTDSFSPCLPLASLLTLELTHLSSIESTHFHQPLADAPWFRDAFTSISGVEHHIATQAAYWIDAFGGGRQYHGGDGRIEFHHHHNAASVMTAAGARRWMHHMSLALNFDIDWSNEDDRVKPCIVVFLLTRMRKYARSHGWKFDEGDFDSLR